jgi:hypothetical protein
MITIDTLLWVITAVVACGMAGVLLMGWLKGVHHERELSMKTRRRERLQRMEPRYR